ncbi:MAG: hypothetical protein R6U20_03770, partial [Longimonas sp.]
MQPALFVEDSYPHTRRVVDVLRRENDRIERFTLDNGLECLLKADASAPVVSVQFRIGCGSMHEDQYLG